MVLYYDRCSIPNLYSGNDTKTMSNPIDWEDLYKKMAGRYAISTSMYADLEVQHKEALAQLEKSRQDGYRAGFNAGYDKGSSQPVKDHPLQGIF